MADQITFKEAVSLDLHQLQCFFSLEESGWDPLPLYAKCRLHYLGGDVPEMRKLIENYVLQSKHLPWLAALMEIRLMIRLKIVHPDQEFVISLLDSVQDETWMAEISMVLAMYFEEQKDFAQASRKYKKSAKLFQMLDFVEKSLTAEYNALINETLAHPNKRYLIAYDSFVKKSLAANHLTLAGVCLANLAREYQLLGLHELALAKSDQSLEHLNESSFGTLHYFLSVAQNLDLLIELKRHEKAKRYYEELVSSPYSEIQEIVRVIQRYCKHELSEEVAGLRKNLPEPWQERLTKSKHTDAAMTDIESKIVEHLLEGSKTLNQLAECLYGEKINFESAVARAKQAIYRLRKKKTDLVTFRKGKYELIE